MVEITSEILADLEAKAIAASPSPWSFEDGHVYGRPHGSGSHRGLHQASLVWLEDTVSSCNGCSTYRTRQSDGEYIAALHPTVVLSLVERIRELESENARLTEENPTEHWHDDDGTALWWKGDNLLYVGSPLDLDWPGDDDFDFWTRVPNPREP